MSEPFIEVQAAIRLIDARLDQLRRIVDEFPEGKTVGASSAGRGVAGKPHLPRRRFDARLVGKRS